MLPLTFSSEELDTVPYLLVAVQVNIPESSGKTSAMTKVHISSRGKKKMLNNQVGSKHCNCIISNLAKSLNRMRKGT